MTLFDIKRDIEIENSGGFWCHGCLVGKPTDEQSDDPRYCSSCYDFLLSEAALIEKQKKPDWVPVPRVSESLPDKQNSVTKIPIHGNLQPQETDGIMLQKNKRGRPRKTEGESVTRMTEWRRRKEVRGVLL